MVALIKGKWSIDPSPGHITEHTKAWIYGNRPFERLQWDPGEYIWKSTYMHLGKEGMDFFKYSVKMGRSLLIENEEVKPAAEKRWEEYGLHKEMRRPLWTTLWNNKQARKITVFQWLVIHKGIVVGERAKGMNVPIDCPFSK